MPSPVDAFPWGSRSTIITFSPTAASAVPRLMAVVVLPTPPFWLATTRMRSDRSDLAVTPQPPDAYDAASFITHGGYDIRLEFPRFRCFLKLQHNILSL